MTILHKFVKLIITIGTYLFELYYFIILTNFTLYFIVIYMIGLYCPLCTTMFELFFEIFLFKLKKLIYYYKILYNMIHRLLFNKQSVEST